jgi:hypothetical protein
MVDLKRQQKEDYAIVVYESGTMLYACKAPIGAALASASWQIKRIDTSSGVVIKWAQGDSNYNNAATDLATVSGYTYT